MLKNLRKVKHFVNVSKQEQKKLNGGHSCIPINTVCSQGSDGEDCYNLYEGSFGVCVSGSCYVG